MMLFLTALSKMGSNDKSRPKIWKDTITAYFKVLSQHLLGDTETNF
jgi:hypothetical protein